MDCKYLTVLNNSLVFLEVQFMKNKMLHEEELKYGKKENKLLSKKSGKIDHNFRNDNLM